MSPTLAAAVALALLAIATVAGVVLRRRDGIRRPGHGTRFDAAHAAPQELGAKATLVQFSTDTCARCPQVRRMLHGLAEERPGVRHVEVDLTRRADLSARYRVLQTPTTFVVDATGAVRARFHGVPQPHALDHVLASL